MSRTLTGVAVWRRIALVAVTMMIAVLALSAGAPQEAQAFRDPNTVLANHEGWVKTRPLASCLALSCPVAMHQAYQWTGREWRSVWLNSGIDVYVYPYSSPWHWVWTRKSGWLAVPNSSLETGYHCFGYHCPVF